MKANLRLLKLKAARAANKRPEPVDRTVRITREQVQAIAEYQRVINEANSRQTSLLIGILTGHGITAFANARLDGNRMTVLDQTAAAAWDEAHPPEPPQAVPENKPADKKEAAKA